MVYRGSIIRPTMVSINDKPPILYGEYWGKLCERVTKPKPNGREQIPQATAVASSAYA